MVEQIEVIELGRLLALEVETDDQVGEVTWPRRTAPKLYWDVKAKRLLAFESKPTAKHRVTESTREQLATYRRWHAGEPTQARVEAYNSPREKWRTLGVVRRVDYWSPKWGRSDEYTHPSTGGTVVRVAGGVYEISGKMRLTKRGLVG